MNMTVRHLGDLMLENMPISMYRFFIPRDVIGLFYHMVSDKAVPHTKHLYPHRDVNMFEEDLIYIKENYKLLSFTDLISGQSPVSRGGKPAVFLSFDDGFSECYSLVRPLLLKHDLPCMFFITTNFIDNAQMYYRNKVSLCIDRLNNLGLDERMNKLVRISDRYDVKLSSGDSFVRWIKSITDDSLIDEICLILNIDIGSYLSEYKPYMRSEHINRLVSDGFTIGAHSQRHQKLGRLTHEEIEVEIVGSCDYLRDITGVDYVPFSFPNTATGIDRDYLHSILKQHTSIRLLFDAKGLERDRKFIFNRIWVESPKLNAGGRESLQQVIKSAYKDYLIQSIDRKRRSL
jgi:peptidoglycan/xylan/chitin deacetylase (PgdA/CDA1 family)